MSDRRVRVGIVGLTAGRSWASVAHLPALRALPEDFEVVGVANSSRASAEAAAMASGIPRAFGSVAELVASPDVDVVTITVKVPHHLELVKAALAAGKHVYCEWPLGNGLAEAEDLAALAEAKGVLGVVGTQARVAPEIEYLRRLVAEGYVGEVLSSTLAAWGGNWGATIESAKTYGYLLDRANGASMLEIPVAHTLAALRDVLGDIAEIWATLARRRTAVRDLETGGEIPMTAYDQIVAGGTLASGAPLSLHFRGGAPRAGAGLIWEINGGKGDVRITGAIGLSELVPLSLESVRDGEPGFAPVEVPASYRTGYPADVVPGNVARIYARMAADLRTGSHTAPTFADAVGLHRLLAAIETASETGARVRPDAANRPLPAR